MFLFENFAYNDSWASQYYESFYDASEYFMEYLNANLPFDNIFYTVSRRCTPDHKNNKYEVTCVDKRDIFKKINHKKYFAYVYDKIKEYGDCVEICKTQTINSLFFMYYIEKDEMRWNIEKHKYKIAFESDEILNCIPTYEQWIYMICAKFERKNPNNLFSKEKSVESVAAKYIIATKLNWEDAACSAMNKISELLTLPQNIEKYSSMFKKFIKGYANESYELNDNEIIELINDFKSASKDASVIPIPTKMNGILKTLDNNELVKKYMYVKYSEIQIMTTNNNLGSIIIEKDEPIGGDFYKIVLHLKGEPFIKDKKSHSYKYKALNDTVDSAVRAIYNQDPNELDKL